MKPLITALLDTYNHERYIEQALVSVVEQGLSPSELEIVVVDDGSTDSTPSIVQKFVPRVKHLRKKNGGQASAFNAGFSEAGGQSVALLDGDDWWAKGKLSTVLQALEQEPEVAAISHAYYRYHEKSGELNIYGPSERTLLGLSTPDKARLARRDWGFLQPSALTVRRTLLERIMPIPEVLVFNADSPIATASMAMGARVLPQALSYYRFHGQNLYEIDHKDSAKLLRRYEMDDMMYSVLWPMLLRLGISEECVSILLDQNWIWSNRTSLHTFGGSRLKTLRTEMRCFRSTCENPTFAYRLFKYIIMVPATLLLPPRQFYDLRNWYTRQNLARLRGWLFGAEHPAGSAPPQRAKAPE
ncbi:MAG: glucosyl transferase [Candidatus Acidoferrum typicum]|nr:glucosyl transferase [Candidatus Acidoferrum typicum]